MFRTRNILFRGPATGRDQNLVGGHAFSVNVDGVSVAYPGPSGKMGDTRLVQQPLINTV